MLRGFTLIELLVSIGIIAVLVAILLPTVGRARHESVMIQCAQMQHSYVQTMVLYASDHKGVLPRFDGNTGAGNPHDIAYGFYMMLTHYGLKHRDFFCPFTDNQTIDIPLNRSSPRNQVQQGFALWTPRINKSYGDQIPPDPPSPLLVGTQPIKGPSYIGDPQGRDNPVLTDDIYLFQNVVSSPATFNLATAPPTDFYLSTGDSSHIYRGRLDYLNETYIDLHTERVAPTAARIVFDSHNAWVVR